MTIQIIKKTLAVSAFALVGLNANAQDIMQVNHEFSKTINYDFNEEWQYLTSELYMFNGSKFQNLITELYPVVKKKKGSEPPEPQNILITSTINGTALGDLSYPIFNFNIKSSEAGPKTLTTDSYESIRLLDNLPLSSINRGKVECKIDVDVITKDNTNRIFDFVAAQLKSVSSWTTAPLATAQTFVGELGRLIKSKTDDKEYKFSSTIRLYDDQDFDKRIASINVYSFITSKATSANIDSADIAKYMDTYDNPKLDKGKISSLIKNSTNPYIVIVNYKSKYVSEPVIGDETSPETVEARYAKVKKMKESGLLSNSHYKHEIKFLEFLRTFVQLKQTISNYNLNYKNKITDDFSKMYLQVFDNYRALRNLYASRTKEYSNDPIYINEFKKLYLSILSNSDVYMDVDNNLKNIKNIVQTMQEYSDNKVPATFDAERNEKKLSILHSVELKSESPNHDGIAELKNLISKIETEQYRKLFVSKENKLKVMQPSATATAYCETLKNEISNTYCEICREQASVTISEYMQRLDSENNRLAKKKLENASGTAKDQIFAILQREKIIQKHFDEDYQKPLPPDVQYVYDEFLTLQKKRGNLQASVEKDYSDLNTTQIDLKADNINMETQELAKILESLCKKMPNLCN